jgi:hypothetical protein
MQHIEMIQLRTRESNLDRLIVVVSSAVQLTGIPRQPACKLRFFKNALIDGDFMLHLIWEEKLEGSAGSTLGQYLSGALSDYGLVNHTIWSRIPQAQHNL